MNDTTRELGGALGVAVLGSLVASHYASAIGKVPGFAGLPVARRSLGTALEVAAAAGGRAPGLAAAARSAFVDAMSVAFLVAAGVALGASAMIAWFMPARNDARGLHGQGMGGEAVPAFADAAPPGGPRVEPSARGPTADAPAGDRPAERGAVADVPTGAPTGTAAD